MTVSPAKYLWNFLRWAVGVALLVWVLSRSDVKECIEIMQSGQPSWILVGIVCTFIGLLFGTIRWHRLLRVQELSLSFQKVFRYSFIGQFFNSFMLGGCGGDLVRAYYVCREFGEGRRAEATATVIADRLIGLITLILFGSLIILARLPLFIHETATQLPSLLMMGFLAGTLLVLFLFFQFERLERTKLFQLIESRIPMFGQLSRRTYAALNKYRADRKELLIAIVHSLMVTIFLALACYAFGRSLWSELELLDVLVFFPIITVLLSIPITPGGIGIREILFSSLFGAVGMPITMAIGLSFLVFGGGVFWSLFGAIFYFLGGKSRTAGF